MITLAADCPLRNRNADQITARTAACRRGSTPAAAPSPFTFSCYISAPMTDDKELLAGIAVNGPWQGFIEEARNPKKRHYAWGYSLRTDVSTEAAEALKSGDKKRRIKNGTRVHLACWEPGKDDLARI